MIAGGADATGLTKDEAVFEASTTVDAELSHGT
jgi:hypothetical protein